MRADTSVLLNIWAYDSPASLELSLASIAGQSSLPSELVVVVDGPVPRELNSVLEIAVLNFNFQTTIHRLHQNQGLWHARSVGVRLCKYEIVALHDADDVMHPDRLRKQLRAFIKYQPTVLGCPAYEFDIDSHQIVGLRRTKTRTFLTSRDVEFRNPIHHSSVMLSRSQVISAGLYQDRPGIEDLDLWRRLLERGGTLLNTPEILQALGTSSALLGRRRISRNLFQQEIALAIEQSRRQLSFSRGRALLGFLVRCCYRTAPVSLMKLGQRLFLRSHMADSPVDITDFLSTKARTVSPR
jgi:glycosyltransferase involved in cell wall biosynthesis